MVNPTQTQHVTISGHLPRYDLESGGYQKPLGTVGNANLPLHVDGNLSIRDAFARRISFNGAAINGDVRLEGCSTYAHGNIEFNECQIKGNLYLHKSQGLNIVVNQTRVDGDIIVDQYGPKEYLK